MSVGSRLKKLRISRNLTQKELSVKTGLSLSSIISYENNLREPNLRAVVAIERFFGITADYLITKDYTDEKSQPNKGTHSKPYIDVSTHKVTRHGIKINGKFYEFQDYLFYIGTFVNVISGKVYGLDGKFLGELSF